MREDIARNLKRIHAPLPLVNIVRLHLSTIQRERGGGMKKGRELREGSSKGGTGSETADCCKWRIVGGRDRETEKVIEMRNTKRS